MIQCDLRINFSCLLTSNSFSVVEGTHKCDKMLDFVKLAALLDGLSRHYGYFSQETGRVICALTVCVRLSGRIPQQSLKPRTG